MITKITPGTSGFLLALCTSFLWGILPVFLQYLLLVSDATSITQIRFLFAGLFVFVGLLLQRKLPRFRQAKGVYWLVLVFSGLCLVTNYVTNVMSLQHVSAETMQLVMQLAPFLLMLGGLAAYKETFNRYQLFGAVILIIGLGIFFNQRIPVILASAQESLIGIYLTLCSAIAWATYALLQKKLLRQYTGTQVTLVLYVMGAILLLPVTNYSNLTQMTLSQVLVLLFCCLNTLVAYGAFTKALEIWQASKVSAILAIAPVFTYFSNQIALKIIPSVFIDAQLNVFAYIGGIMVICGAMFCALARNKSKVS